MKSGDRMTMLGQSICNKICFSIEMTATETLEVVSHDLKSMNDLINEPSFQNMMVDPLNS